MLQNNDFFKLNTISPYEEMLAYETLWMRKGATIKHVSEWLNGVTMPSQALDSLSDIANKQDVEEYFEKIEKNFSIMTSESFQYPPDLRDAKYPIKILYYRGDIDLLTSARCVSIVGARKASADGAKRASRIARELVAHNFTIVSGLAEGIDTAAIKSTLQNNGRVIGVIGTPINEYYPKENRSLQEDVATNQLLISHVPIYRYSREHFATKKFYFPQRNIVMAAVSEATVIVEASDTSGTLTQARACIEMGRKLFILNSCFERTDITWPKTYEKKGAIRVNTIDDILKELCPNEHK